MSSSKRRGTVSTSQLNQQLLRSPSPAIASKLTGAPQIVRGVDRRQFLKLTGAATAGAALVHTNRIRLAVRDDTLLVEVNGVPRWTIAPSLFAGNPRLRVVHRGDNGFRFILTNARYPGTRVSPDIDCKLTYSLFGPQLELRFLEMGWSCCIPAVDWLVGAAVATLHNSESIPIVAHTTQLGPQSLNASTIEFTPEWTIRMRGEQLGHLRLSRNVVSIHTATLSLVREDTSLLRNPAKKRAILQVDRGPHSWDLFPDELRPDWTLQSQVDKSTFDDLLFEYSESRSGKIRSAALAESRSNALQLAVPGGIKTADGAPLALPLASVRLARFRDQDQHDWMLVAELPDQPTWLHADGFSAAVSKNRDNRCIELSSTNGSFTTVKVQPKLHKLEIPIPGADLQTSVVASDATFPFRFCCLPRRVMRHVRDAAGALGNDVVSLFVKDGTTILNLNKHKVSVIRAADMLNLTFEFRDLSLHRVFSRPRLFASGKQAKPRIIVHLPAQSIGEQAFPETDAVPKRSARRLGGESRLAFAVPVTEKEGLDLTLENLLSWGSFTPLLSDTAKYKGDIPGPAPQEPGEDETAIEIPFRLILSPADTKCSKWEQTPTPHLDQDKDVELWRAALFNEDVRAVWARDYPEKQWPGCEPGGAPYPADADPFLMNLNRKDRFQIVEMSSDFSIKFGDWRPTAIRPRHLMLSSLGGWLQSYAEWATAPNKDWPDGNCNHVLELHSWKHESTIGRDHYTRVAYRGFLFPVGHRADLVKETVRRFYDQNENIKDPNRCYLRQQCYIVVRQRSRTYPGFVDTPSGKVSIEPFESRDLPFSEIQFETLVTPPFKCDTDTSKIIWPPYEGHPFRFDITCIDRQSSSATKRISLSVPFAFVPASLSWCETKTGQPVIPDELKKLISDYNGHLSSAAARRSAPNPADLAKVDDCIRVADAHGQKIHYAPSTVPGDTEIETQYLAISAALVNADLICKEPDASKDALRSNELPLFRPILGDAEVHVPAVEMLNPAGTLPIISLNDGYVRNGISGIQAKVGAGGATTQNAGEVFADLSGRGFDFPPDKSGGIVTPSINVTSLSRKLGPLAGKADDFLQGVFAPLDFFDKLDATLLGVVPLSQLIQPIKEIRDEIRRVPQFLLQQAQGYAKQIDDTLNSTIQAYVASLTALIDTYLAQLAAWAQGIYKAVKPQWDAVGTQIDAFVTIWAQLTAVIGPELGDLASQAPLTLPPDSMATLFSLVQAKRKGAAEFKQINAMDGSCPPIDFFGVSVYPLQCIQERVHSALLAEQTIARSAAQDIESRLKASRATLDANGKVISESLVGSLAHMRALFAQVLTTLKSLPDGDLRRAFEALQQSLAAPSLDGLVSLPGVVTDLWNAIQKQAANLQTTAGGVSSLPEAEVEILLRTLASVAADIENQEQALKTAVADRFASMQKEATDALAAVESMTGKNYQSIKDELARLQTLANQVTNYVPNKLKELRTTVDNLKAQLQAIANAIVDDYRKTVQDAIRQVTDKVNEVRNKLLSPVELKLNYDFAPSLKDAPSDHPVFRATLDGVPSTMEVHLAIRQALNPLTGHLDAPSTSIQGFVRDFQIVLLPQLTFLTVKMKEVSFKALPGQSVDVHIQISKVEFGDCLNFIKALVESLPFLGNKGNGPFLDIRADAVAAGYRFGIGKITLGAINVFNVAIEAGITLSLTGAPMTARFSFCSRERPFLVSSGLWGGGGFFAIEATAREVVLLEGSFEFGGVLGLSIGPASGLVTVTAGIYFSIRPNRAELAGFFQVTGDFDIAHIIHMSLLFYLGLSYVSEGGRSLARGQVTVHVSIELGFFFKVSYDLHSERTIAGGGGNTMAAKKKPALIASDGKLQAPTVPITNDGDYALLGITEDAWNQYSSAFA